MTRLKEIVDQLGAVLEQGHPEVEISGVTCDSRQVKPGDLFAAVRGFRSDGRLFVEQAVASGAAAILTDAPLEKDCGRPVVLVEDVRAGMALAAAEVYGRPADEMVMIGITGTNGKTTTTYLLESILNHFGLKTGVLGTISYRFGDRSQAAPLTTPEGPDLQRMLAEMRDAGAGYVVMEVASHALSLRRVAGCRYDLALFTNLTQDHLDYHGDFEAYYQAKRKLFFEYLDGRHLPGGPRAVVNTDDEWGRRLADELGTTALTYGVEGQPSVRVNRIRSHRGGLDVDLETSLGEIKIESRLIGYVNVYNLTAAAATAVAMGLDPSGISAGLSDVTGVPGRLERVGTKNEFLALVDFAHTPDALTRALKAALELEPKRLITVFGCGGDRDRTKRPLMGRAVGSLSHLSVVTSDNPRTEDPLKIIEDTEEGMKDLGLERLDPNEVTSSFYRQSYVMIPNRREAIRLAVRIMNPGDIVLVAGKGHEDYQILGREKIRFDDREEVKTAMKMEGKL